MSATRSVWPGLRSLHGEPLYAAANSTAHADWLLSFTGDKDPLCVHMLEEMARRGRLTGRKVA